MAILMQTRRASSRSHSILLWICMVCLLIIKAWCIDSLKQGESLNSSSQLDSPNGLFTLRFYSPQETNSTYIAVLFNGGEVAPVWIGNRDMPIPNDITPLLTLGTRGELVITTGEGGTRIELYAGGTQRLGNITATLLDSGNFVVGSSDGDLLLWQSFDHPTDTLLSGMRLGFNRKIYSWLTPSDPARGDFTLEWDQSSGELLIRRQGVVYWRSGHLKDYYNQYLGNVKAFENFRFRPDPINFNYDLTTEFAEIGGDYFVYRVISVAGMTPDSRKVSSGWRLDGTGDVSMIDDRGIIVAQASVCYGNNRDGSNSSGAGCQPPCRMNGHQSFDLRSGLFTHANTSSVTPTLDNDSRLSLRDCREACWSNCECAGYFDILGQENGCIYWIGKDLVWDQDNEGSFSGIYVLQSPPGEEVQVTGKKKNIGIIAGVVVSAAVLLMLGLAYFIIRKIKRKREEKLHQLLTLEGYTGSYGLEIKGANGHHLKPFTYASILSATNNFSSNNKLGQGGFGPVYKGRTTEGQDIAVKLLSRQSGQGVIEFRNELILISELQHVNLVKLIGFCVHKDDKMIIYDYMPNKSLDCFLFNPSKREQLDWKKRFNIIEGTAQGLLYLHKHSRLRIIHRDMKPNNILLDENMTPKISDFGLARIFKEDASEVNTERRVGTYGYMAPEYAMQGIFSVKTDVYSFGVLVLEVVSGRRNSSFHDIEGPLSIVQYAWELWRKDRALELMDPMLSNSCIRDQLQKCIQIGLLCVENHAVDRPTIEDALLMLKNETVTLPMPTNPAFITRKNSMVQQEENTPEKLSSDELIKLPANQFIKKKLTANQVTLSEVQGR